ncbi:MULTISPECIES: 30S ribosomal protein S12 methylthiotransferase RimO [Jonquetella]|uniref:Ribosomal protein uS12 methylthiotransferase RimO n=1 Tax=Jonquetella anthropi DSM 22815 TaxID=885272 RepID=H0UJ14_9BACT|nr:MULTISPECIES: 30S ribosomal protein S12 methylthiotransferase RimO [Jonquetella]EEX49049.1 ribosomal protein S12 methylthiotransferase RimO [Jonquetella anthropi E3_33 E1]EHM13841.1 ribosomal protein S12 methylthiotransferase RimO [Jonquetella anthropi DSM 22815]ERL23758.1 ribosomal protein S12 methylthiotransferase RimO [Jonquetella sp. BV3C21]
MKTAHIVTLGCPKNEADSERLAGIMARAGFSLTDKSEGVDLILLNTCGFIQPAVEEGISTMLDMETMKARGDVKALAVVGCMVNRYGDDLKKEFPTVDYWARSEQWQELIESMGATYLGDGRHILTRTPWTRYLKISEGCNCQCSYCAIPGIRGRLCSRPIDELVQEAGRLVSEGAKELCLVGQELTEYGADLYKKRSLPKLLTELEKTLPQSVWLRLFYLHPSHLDTALLEQIASSKQIVPWLDVPIQHIDNQVLERMARPPVETKIRSLFKIAREINPDFAFRTTLMVGFPGETRRQFDRLLDFVEDIQFDRLGAFTYSPEDGTKAASFPDQIPEDEKGRRYDELMSLQQSISRRRQALFVGRRLDVLVEEVDQDGTRWGRSYRDAPEIDGAVALSGSASQPGDIVSALIDDSSEYDLFGRPVESEGKS